MPPFIIDRMATALQADPLDYRARFDAQPAFLFDDPFAPEFLVRLMAQSAAASFVDDDVEQIGTRQIEAPQRVGGAISILLARSSLLTWLEAATGTGPLRAVAGRLVQTRANGRDALAWHDDRDSATRKLAVVINLSDRPFDGGRFDLRHAGTEAPIVSHRHDRAGAIMVFAVRKGLEHRVTQVTAGGPRRVYAGWFLTEPEHHGGLARA